MTPGRNARRHKLANPPERVVEYHSPGTCQSTNDVISTRMTATKLRTTDSVSAFYERPLRRTREDPEQQLRETLRTLRLRIQIWTWESPASQEARSLKKGPPEGMLRCLHDCKTLFVFVGPCSQQNATQQPQTEPSNPVQGSHSGSPGFLHAAHKRQRRSVGASHE